MSFNFFIQKGEKSISYVCFSHACKLAIVSELLKKFFKVLLYKMKIYAPGWCLWFQRTLVRQSQRLHMNGLNSRIPRVCVSLSVQLRAARLKWNYQKVNYELIAGLFCKYTLKFHATSPIICKFIWKLPHFLLLL